MIGGVLEAMESVPLPAADRASVIEELVQLGVPRGVSTWLTTNLKIESSDEGYVWRVDLNAIRGLLADYFRLDGWPLVEATAHATQVHLVRGGRSDRWTDDEWARVGESSEKDNVFVHVVEDAGHWLHVDNPSGLMDSMRNSPFFSKLSQGPRMAARPGSEGQ